ncbi:hypothetical protein BO86DRAFT_298007, partial [Aspergillus japonicus CBS 114.51]
RLNLAVKAFKSRKFATKAACAAVFNIKISTFKDYLNGIKLYTKKDTNYRKLSTIKENTLKQWLFNIAYQGLP